MTQEQMDEAREQLDKLARELGVYVWTCGCCGGAALRPVGVDPLDTDVEADGNIGEQLVET